MQVGEVLLAPEAAALGLEIRVVGNDSGEKVSILAGTLARLDRDAPHYGRKNYNDFNTFYLQAASGTKGGSSGSPVIDSQGRAVGLNAGGKNKAASAYYLPLERVVRALHLLQQHWPLGGCISSSWSAAAVSRGDLQTTFMFKGFDEVRRLGLRKDTEGVVRAANARSHGAPGATGEGVHAVGMLVVEATVPGSPADSVLEPGDVLVRMNGQVMSHFLALEEMLDDAVGQSVDIELERGGQPVTLTIPVTDLHSVTPSSMLELAGGSLHALSYQQARTNRAQLGQVYVAEPGYVLGRAAVPKFAIITAVDGVATPDMQTAAKGLTMLQHGARVPLEYYTFNERHRRHTAILQVDRQWYGGPVHWVRDDAAGAWHPSMELPVLLSPGWDSVIAPAAAASRAGKAANQADKVQADGSVCNGVVAEDMVMQVSVPDSQQAMADAGQQQKNGMHPIVAASRRKLSKGTTGAAAAGTANGSSAVPDRQGKAQTGVKRTTRSSTTFAADAAVYGSAKKAEAAVSNSTIIQAAATAAAANLKCSSSEAMTKAVEEAMRASLVLVDVDIPLVALSDGVHARSFQGCGLVVYHGEHMGLVLVDRNTVAIGTCDINLSFGAHPAELPGAVRFLHPLHNFALVSYTPAALPAEARAKVRAAQLLVSPTLARGDRCRLVGLSKSLRIMQRTSNVTSATVALTIPSAEVPRFRAVHEEVVKLDHDFGSTFSGVLTNEEGQVRALWGSYAEQVRRLKLPNSAWCAEISAMLCSNIMQQFFWLCSVLSDDWHCAEVLMTVTVLRFYWQCW
eukprot:GHRR01012979.1.p1 GENE.GHRR01012979.1~~GHRR01012979.1.p1  ORF type:complete len:795 (+),score=305.94 GHRR01012979.1:778-3162(+)